MSDPAVDFQDSSRYARQMRFAAIGPDGQRRLASSRVLLCGCGALGSVIANTLVRAGVGYVRLVDRDFLELNNLQRQVLYDEEDIRRGLPKAIAAAEKLKQINSAVEIEPHVTDVSHTNIETLCEGVDLILDGTDNFETRFLLNDAAHRWSIPWIFGGCLGADGQVMVILPGETACLNCLMPDGPPPAGASPTCDSAGILSPIINVVASFQAMEAFKLLSGNREAVRRGLLVFEMWDNQQRQLSLDRLQESGTCPTCQRGEYRWLSGERGSHSAILCGRNAVQLSPPDRQPVDLDQLATQLAPSGEITRNKFLLKFQVDEFTLTLFPDGRAIVHGTEEIGVAKSLYAKWVGN